MAPLQITPKKVRRTNIPDLKPYDYKRESDYSSHLVEAIFKDTIAPDMVTSERARDKGLFTGVVYRPQSDDDEPIFTPLYAFDLY